MLLDIQVIAEIIYEGVKKGVALGKVGGVWGNKR